MINAGVLEVNIVGNVEMVSQPVGAVGCNVDGVTRIGTQKVVIVCLELYTHCVMTYIYILCLDLYT